MYRELKEGMELAATEGLVLRRAMQCPWCWPANPVLKERLLALGMVEPGAPSPGASLLVAVAAGRRTSLWTLTPESATADDTVPLRGFAQETMALACQLAVRHAPMLFRTPRLPPPERWSARFVLKRGEGFDDTLDDQSFGLAMALGAISLLLEHPPRHDLCALAGLRPDGRLAEVGQLRQKLAGLANCGLGVERVLVAASQANEASHIAETLCRKMEIVSVTSLSEALKRCLKVGCTEGTQEILQCWAREGQVEETCDELFRLSVQGSPGVPDWRGVENAARALVTHLCKKSGSQEEDGHGGEGLGAEPLLTRCRFALRVAERHLGEEAPLPWPEDAWLCSLPRPVRLQVLAHVVQSHTDSRTNAEEVMMLMERASAHLPREGEEHAEDLHLLGALGRALAHLRAYDEAGDLLGCDRSALVRLVSATAGGYRRQACRRWRV